MKKVQRYSVQKVTGDGRCMFRALVSSGFLFSLVFCSDTNLHQQIGLGVGINK